MTNPTQNRKTRRVLLTIPLNPVRAQSASSPSKGEPAIVRRKDVRTEYLMDFRTGELHIIPPWSVSGRLPLLASPATKLSPIQPNLAGSARSRGPDAEAFVRESPALQCDTEVANPHAQNSAKTGVVGMPLAFAADATLPTKNAPIAADAEGSDVNVSRSWSDTEKPRLDTNRRPKQQHFETSSVVGSRFSEHRDDVGTAQRNPSASDALRLLRLQEVVRLTGLSRSSLYAAIKLGRFPAQVRLIQGGRAVAWAETDVREWIGSRLGVRGDQAGVKPASVGVASLRTLAQLALVL